MFLLLQYPGEKARDVKDHPELPGKVRLELWFGLAKEEAAWSARARARSEAWFFSLNLFAETVSSWFFKPNYFILCSTRDKDKSQTFDLYCGRDNTFLERQILSENFD